MGIYELEFPDYSDLVIDLRLYTDYDDYVTRYLPNEYFFDEKISRFHGGGPTIRNYFYHNSYD